MRHRSCLRWAGLGVAWLFYGTVAHAEPPTRMPTPFDDLGANVVDVFTGSNLFYYGGAVAATGIMIYGGADHAIRVGFQRHLASDAYGDISLYAGYLLPVTFAPILYLTGLAARDPELGGAGSAVLQALGVTMVTTGILKVGTGRVYPLNGGDPRAPDRLDHPEYAREFHPFQRLWFIPAWPSGHIAGTITIAAALTGYYPDKWWIPLVGYPIAIAIGVGMVDGDHHWASDVVAGGLIGHAMGYSIGRAFRRRQGGARATGAQLDLVPFLPSGTIGSTGLALRVIW